MKTPAQLQERYGLSYGMIRKYVIEQLAEGVQFSKHMNLNGTSKKVIQSIADRSTDPDIKEKALNDIERMSKPVECTLNGFSLNIERALNDIKPPVKEVNDSVNDIEPNVQWYNDIGNYILSAPNVRFLSVATLIAGQAYMFAMLERKVMEGIDLNIELWAAFVIGILFEASGFMIARSFPGSKYGEVSTRTGWLVFFLIIQCVTNFCLVEPFSVAGWSMVGRIIVAIALPAGLLAYSFLYFKD